MALAGDPTGFANGWHNINGYWVSDEVLASNNIYVNQMLLVHQNTITAYPGTPELKTEPLPTCSECQLNEVIPGEDNCRSCLGTPEPPWEWEDMIINMPYPNYAAIYIPATQGNVITFNPPVVMQSGATASFAWSYYTDDGISYKDITTGITSLAIKDIRINDSS